MEVKQKHLISISLLIFYHSMVYATRLKPPSQTEPSKHFVLIHGSGHGAWSWYKIIEPLRASGYTVTAIDLAASGINPTQVKFVESISDYHQPLMDFMASLPQHKKVILVGHSLGGLALTQAMESFPEKVSVAVFVTALMPGPQLNFTTMNQQFSRTTASTLDSSFIYDNGPKNPPTARLWGPLYLRLRMYALSPIQTRPIEVNILPSSSSIRPSNIGVFEGPFEDPLRTQDEVMEELNSVAPVQPPPGYRFPSRKDVDYGDHNSDSTSEEEYPWLWDDACPIHHPGVAGSTWTQVTSPKNDSPKNDD